MKQRLPVEIEPLTLATIGETDLGLIPKAWNAHPRRVASRHTIYQFGVRIGAKVMLDVFALPSAGAPQLLTSLPLPGAMEVHDFFATDNHLVFVLAPLWCSSLELLRNGSFVEALKWQCDAPTSVLIIPLAAPQAVQRIETEPFFFWHGVNAYERSAGRELVLDLVRYPDFAATKIPLDILSDGGSAPPSYGTLWRGVIDLVDRRIAWEERWPAFCEFPAVHKDRQGREYGQAWLASYNTLGQSQWYDTLSCVDLNEDRSRDIFVGNGCEVSEPGLVARSSDEDDVYVLSLIHDNSAAASWLGIWDGARSSDEPLTRIWFDQLLPRPLHGCWMPAA